MLKRFLYALFAISFAFSAHAEEAIIADNFDINTTIQNIGGGPAPYSPEAPTDEGKLRVNCDPSHSNYDDPILFPGQVGAGHLHRFFGNTSTNANSTYASLRTTGGGTCAGGRANRTGYWHPALIRPQNNKEVLADGYELYYNIPRFRLDDYHNPACPGNAELACPQIAAIFYPRGFRFIMGATTTGTPTVAADQALTFQCGEGGAAKRYLWNRSNNALGVEDCPSNEYIKVVMSSSMCWDGTNLTSANGRTHLSHLRDGHSGGGFSCPATHPQALPVFTVIIFFSHNGEEDYSQWYFSSDRFGGADYEAGETLHTDWWGAWSPTVQDTFTAAVNGIPGASGDMRQTNGFIDGNFALRSDVLGANFTTNFRQFAPRDESIRYADIPVLGAGTGRSRMK